MYVDFEAATVLARAARLICIWQLDIPAYALAELQTILKQNPNDTLFTIKRDPGKGCRFACSDSPQHRAIAQTAYNRARPSSDGTAICQEAGCKNKQIPLISNGKGAPA